MVAEEIVVTLSGGAPWGFRLQGGAEHKKPLQVAKVRRRSKACRAGLREADELLSINDKLCGGLSHAQAMSLIDGGPGTLHIRVKRAPSGFQSVVLLTRSPSPRIDKEYRAAVREVRRGALMSPTGRDDPPRRESVTSPPDSEAYYGETDSDADTAHERQRRQKRRSPSGSPAKMGGGKSSPEETSEMSGYESAPDAPAYPDASPPQQGSPPGVARREVIYQPPRADNSPENSSSSLDDQSPAEGPGPNEVDSGFQEPPSLPPLVSPDRAKEALLLASRGQLVPMVGPVDNPVAEELTVTYMDKAKQAKLHRGESVQEKQVKEARSRCRSIAALLTDAPNPHSKGVLMFKKRRQRAKKYTLTCFGSVEGASSQDGTTEEEDDEEEEGVFPGSESELDEDGFTSAPESAWDSDYLDILERKTPAAGCGETESPGLNATSGKGAQLFEQQRRRGQERAAAAEAAAAEVAPVSTYAEQAPPLQGLSPTAPAVPATPSMPALPTAPAAPAVPAAPVNYSVMNGDCTVVSRASVVMSPPVVNGGGAGPPGSVLNRTAQPFAAGFVSHRAATTPVLFRPGPPKKSPPAQPAATARATPLPFSPPPSEVKRAVSTTSLYIPPRPAPRNAPPSMLSPPSSVAAAPYSPFSPSSTTATPFSRPPLPAPSSCNPPAQATPFSPPPAQAASFHPPPAQATPFSPPPAQAASFHPPPAQATPFSPPPAQAASFYPPPAQATPFYPPPVQATPLSPPAPRATSVYLPPARVTPFSPPPAQVMPFSPPPAQPMPFSPPPAQVVPFSSPPTQPTPFSPPPTQPTPYSTPPAQAITFSQPPVQAMPFSPPPTHTTSYYPPPTQTPASPYSTQAIPFSPLPVQAISLTLAPAPVTTFPPPPAPPTTCPTPTPATPFSPSSTPVGPLSPPAFSPPAHQPCAVAVPPPPTPKVSFNPYVAVATTTPSPPVSATPAPAPTPVPTQYPAAAANSAEALASREQRISVPAARTGILQEARRRGSKKPMFSAPEEKKQNSPNPELLSLVQNLDEKPRAGAEPGFESGPEEDFLNLGAEACNFMQVHKSRLPPPVAPKPHAAPEGPQIPQMGGKGAELFARRQSRMDRYVVDRTAPAANLAVSPGQPRLPSPTPSLPSHWKYSPNIRAPPPISYNPLLSPSCPPGAQRGTKASQTAKVAKKSDAQKQPPKPMDVMSRQPYQLNSAMFTYGGGGTPAPGNHQSQSISLSAPKQIPVKAARVYNIKRFSTPTPMSAPASLSPAVIAPRSATTLGEPLWRPDVVSPPPAPLSPPPPAPTGALPELPRIYSAPVPNPAPAPAPPPGSAYAPLQNGRQWFKSAPELSPLCSAVSGSSLSVRVPRPRFSTSSMGIQANVWRPGSVHY
ncbi:synaptopodin 2-like protein [Anguilla rostrata]|uniref:synaptopodin 2-like protein n=1 Tax=Anguilla rostrata TaxID=7938 RepID=UPI0030CE64A8